MTDATTTDAMKEEMENFLGTREVVATEPGVIYIWIDDHMSEKMIDEIRHFGWQINRINDVEKPDQMGDIMVKITRKLDFER